MESAFALSTPFFTPFTLPAVRNRRLNSRVCIYTPFSLPTFSLKAVPTIKCVNASKATEGVSEAIVLNVGGMSSNECASRVKTILQSQDQVYVAGVNLAKETAIVWPVSEAKAEPNWDKLLGDELANHLTSRGFKSSLQDLHTFHGWFKSTPYTGSPGHTFASLAPHESELESHAKQVDALKLEVKNLLLASTRELTDNIHCINSLCRLGVSYHFEDEIEDQLRHLFTKLPTFLEDNDYDLCTVANFFHVLRKYGYNVPNDVFKKFRNPDGEFKKDIANDVKGIICLYEACFLAVPDEEILDEALAFTRNHLKVIAENSSESLQKYIRHALTFPCHRTGERLDTLHYISYYEEDESANEIFLKFAKLDFNSLQLLYRKELSILSKWWIDENMNENFPFHRERLVDTYLWAIGCIFEPQYSSSRMMIAKNGQFFTTVDDTFDTYGTFEHLKLLTDSIQRMTMDAVSDGIPEYMKHICRILFDDLENHNGLKGCTFDELQKHNMKGCSDKTSDLKEMMKAMVRGNFVEATWKKEGKIPSFDEYMENGRVTGAFGLFSSSFLRGMKDMDIKEITWLRNEPEMVIAAQFLGRLLNDMSGLTDEKQRQDYPKSFDCYMEQYGVSKDEAVEAIRGKIMENKWRILNKERMMPSNMPKILLKFMFNYCRATIHMNGVIDLYTYPADLNELIKKMLLEPFPV